MKNISNKTKRECCGCLACVHRCPKNAIEISYDEEGFVYPKVNDELCISCGICSATCRFSNKENVINSFSLENIYAAKNKDDSIRKRSASGGMFSYISDIVLERQGVIYGCILTKQNEAMHIRATKHDQRDLMCGSKYVQSNMEDVYRRVEADLETGRMVLFTGTPCQLGGLRGYLRKTYSELYLCDIICHGVPSPKIYKEYIAILEQKYHSSVDIMMFRDKSKGWINQFWTVVFQNKHKISNTRLILMFKKLFYNHYIIRPSCHNCVYSNMNRISDITIGDFWGIREFDIDMYDSLGVSLVILNSKKGKELFLEYSDRIEIKRVEDGSYLQPQLQHPTTPAYDRAEFWDEYHRKGFMRAMKKYGRLDRKTKLKLLIPTCVKDKLKKR